MLMVLVVAMVYVDGSVGVGDVIGGGYEVDDGGVGGGG